MTEWVNRDWLGGKGGQGSRRTYGPAPAKVASIIQPYSPLQMILDDIQRRRARPGETREARVCAGGPSQFTPSTNQPTFPSITFGPDEEPEEEEVLWHDEIWKETQDYRIEAADIPEIFVITQRRMKAIFRGEDGRLIGLRLNNDDLPGDPV
jgi:hypothetical protein